MQEYLIRTLFRGMLWEIIAVLSGLYFLFHSPKVFKHERWLVYYLCFTVFVEFLGLYSIWAYFSEYEVFSFVKGTRFEANFWMFNIFKVITMSFYFWFFYSQLKKSRIKNLLKILYVVFLVVSSYELIFSGELFIQYIISIPILGSILLLTTLGAYFFMLLRSNKVINFFRTISFYLAFGALIWHLVMSPLFIFNKLEGGLQGMAGVIYGNTMTFLNILLYTLIAGAFIAVTKSRKRAAILNKPFYS